MAEYPSMPQHSERLPLRKRVGQNIKFLRETYYFRQDPKNRPVTGAVYLRAPAPPSLDAEKSGAS